MYRRKRGGEYRQVEPCYIKLIQATGGVTEGRFARVPSYGWYLMQA